MIPALLFAAFAVLLLLGVPIGVALGLAGAVCIGLANQDVQWFGLLAVPQNFYAGLGKYPLLAIPMFVLVGSIFERSGVALRLVNFALAIALSAAIFVAGRSVPAYRLEPPVIRSIAANSPGAQAGFRKGDRILSIDGSPTPTWQEAEFAFSVAPRQKLAVEIERDGARQTIPVVPRAVSKFDLGFTGLGPALPPKIGRVLPRSPAQEAGLRPGDLVKSIDGEKVESLTDVTDAVARHAPGPETFLVSRGGQPVSLAVRPRQESGAWKIGVQLEPDVAEVIERYPPGEAIRQGWRSLRTDTQATLAVLAKLFQGKASVKQMSGPIAIGQFAGEAAREGIGPFIALMGMLSLQLGILNLLPVPMLDGGQLAVVVIEGALRRDFSLRVKERILQFGFVLLVLLMGIVIYNDILKVF